MAVLKTLALILVLLTLTACQPPQPGSADYERYLRSKANREATMYQGL